MSLFGTPPTDATLEARVAQLEALVATLSGTVDDNASASQGAVDAVAQLRAAGDAAGLAAVNAAIDGSVRRTEAVASQLGDEIIERSRETARLGQRVDAVTGEAVQQSVASAVNAIADDVAAVEQSRIATLTARDQAQAAAATALFGTIFVDYAAGLAATAIGQQWVSYGPAGAYATRWLKTGANAATAIDAYPSKSVVDAIGAILKADALAGWASVDADGIPEVSTDGRGRLIVRMVQMGDTLLTQNARGYIEVYGEGNIRLWTNDPAMTRTFTRTEGAQIDDLRAKVDVADTKPGWASVDADGIPEVSSDGKGRLAVKAIRIGNGLEIVDDGRGHLEMRGEGGIRLWSTALFARRSELASGGTTGGSSLAARDAANMARAAAAIREGNPAQQHPVAGAINIIGSYGQSPSRGQEGWPAKSKVARPGVFTLGRSTRPNTQTGTAFDPVGGVSALFPGKAVVHINDTILTDAEVAALAPGANVPGEDPVIGAANYLHDAWLTYRGLDADPDTLFVAISCGVGGKQVSELLPGASPNYFGRFTSAIEQIKAIGAAMGKPVVYLETHSLQGEEDYEQGAAGAYPSKAAQKAARRAMKDAITQAVRNILGQTLDPAYISYQTSGFNTKDSLDLHVGQAQLENAIELRGEHMATPDYPVTDKGVHKDANGYRWLGMLGGRTSARIHFHGEKVLPTHPVRWTLSGRDLIGDFHVPVPPLQWKAPYVGHVATDYADRGFLVRDNSGPVPLLAVELAGWTIVRLTLARDPVGTVYVLGGSQSGSGGNLCLCDSAADIFPEAYAYQAGSGDYASANIPALVGKPYPPQNFCANFIMKAEVV